MCVAFAMGDLCAQKRFLSLSTADGLPQNSVECFAQDSAGFLWIGTQDGLARFDGHEFKIYRSNARSTKALSDNFITELFVDDDGGLWVGTRNGVNYYDDARDCFVKFMPSVTRLHQKVHGISQGDRSHHAFVFMQSRVYEIDKNGPWLDINELDSLPKLERKVFRGCQQLLKIDDQWLTISADGLGVCDSDNCETYPLKPWPQALNSNFQLVEGKSCFWVIADGLFRVDKGSLEAEHVFFDGWQTVMRLNSLVEIDDEIWLSTDQGLFILDANDPEKLNEHCVHNPKDPFTINYDFVHGIFQDREKRVWVGTANSGLNIYDPDWRHLHYVIYSEKNTALQHPLVWGGHQDSHGWFWVGTAEGLQVFQKGQNGLFEVMETDLSDEVREIQAVRDIQEGPNGDMWIASARSGLYCYNRSTQSLRAFNNLGNEFVALELDSKGGLWAASYNGLYYKPTGLDKFQRLDKRHKLSSYCMSVERSGEQVFVSHSAGFSVFETMADSLSVLHTKNEPGDTLSLPFSICSGGVRHGDKVYVGMYDRGMAILDGSLQVLETIDESHGLSGHVVEAMLKDKNEHIWIATNQGLSRFDPSTKEIKNITVQSGLRNQEFALNAAFVDSEGWLYFGSVDGLLYFHPDSVFQGTSNAQSPIQLSGMELNYHDYRESDNSAAQAALRDLKHLSLRPDDRVFSVTFSAMQFANASQLNYFYRMKGFDNHWVAASTEARRASYSSLPSGDYVFEVEARFVNGENVAKPFQLAVSVLPRFYEMLWFRLTSLAVIVLMIASTVRYFARRKYRKQLLEMKTRERIQNERERISRDLHDNVGSQITYMISSLDNLAYKSSKAGDQQSHSEIDGLGDFARDTMQQLREAIWVINKDMVSLDEFRLKLEEYCQKHLSVSGLSWKTNIVDQNNTLLQPGAVLHLFRICQEAINNIVKHAQAKSIAIQINAEGQTIHLSIQDDGIGFDALSRKSGHYGLDNMVERAKQMGASIEWRSEAGQGTIVSVELPVS